MHFRKLDLLGFTSIIFTVLLPHPVYQLHVFVSKNTNYFLAIFLLKFGSTNYFIFYGNFTRFVSVIESNSRPER